MKSIFKNWHFLLIAIFYFFSRLWAIKLIPIFTDEAIYTRWAQVALNDPANRYISLEDGKQPLFIWLSAISQKFVHDPLIANRLVSVSAGFGSLIGIYFLAKELLGQKEAKLAAILYIISPFFLLYDKLGIYDSLLTTLGIWAVFFSVKMAKKAQLDLAFLNGFAIGLALITKSSASFFLYLLPFSLLNFNLKAPKVGNRFFNWIKFSFVTFVLAEAFYNSLRLSPLFYIIKMKNYEFIRPFSEVLHDPLHFAFSNFKGLTGWLITYTTWPLFLLFLAGLVWGFKRKDKKIIYLSILIFAPFTAEILFNKIIYPRFMLFYFPYVILVISYCIASLFQTFAKFQKQLQIALLAILILPAYTSIKLLTAPAYANIPKSDSNQYFNDWPAGYGVVEVVSFLKEKSQNEQIYVGTQGTFGLFPFALNIYFRENQNLHIVSYWPVDPEKLPQEIVNYSKKYKTYFIFNENQRQIANKNLKFIAKYQKGKSNSYMRLYEVLPAN